MKRTLFGIIIAFVVALGFPATAFAQSGHFISNGGHAVECTDEGTTLSCTGKVAGLGGTTFEITVEADGLGLVECTNPGGNVAPGQDTDVDASGSSGPQETPRNGQFVFGVATAEPDDPPGYPTCPNPMWDAEIVDVIFTSATLTLLEDGNVSDTLTITF